MNQKKIGAFIKELRNEKNLTQEQFAEILGVSNRSISRWENGNNMPDFDLVIEIANYFDITIDEFLDGERKTEMIDDKEKETLLKVSDYNNAAYITFSRKICVLFIFATIAFIIYAVLEMLDLASTGTYEFIASCSLGFVFGMLLVGILYSSGYLFKIKAAKQRVFNKLKNRK